MKRKSSSFVIATFRTGAVVSVILLFSGSGLAQKVVTAKATIPFSFWAEGHEFQAGDYVFDNEVPGSVTIRREGEKYFLVELWGMQARYVVTAEFEHRGEANDQQRQVPLTILESHDR